MKSIEANRSTAEIQLFRLHMLKRVLESVDPISVESLFATYHMFNGHTDFGFVPTNIPERKQFTAALAPFTETHQSAIDIRLEEMAFSDVSKLGYDKKQKRIAGIRKIIQDIVAEDEQTRKQEANAMFTELAEMLDLSAVTRAKKNTQDRAIQDAVIGEVYENFTPSYRAVRKGQKKQANRVILGLVKKRHKAALHNVERAIVAKEAAIKHDQDTNPTIANIHALSQSLGLKDVERDILIYYADLPFSKNSLLRQVVQSGSDNDAQYQSLATLLGHTADDVMLALDPESQLRQANLIIMMDQETIDQNKTPTKYNGSSTSRNRMQHSRDILEQENRTTLFQLPAHVMLALRAKNSGIRTLMESLRGQLNPTNDFTLDAQFADDADDARRIAANMVNDLLNPGKGRKGRYLAGPAGSGKNSMADVLGREIGRILNDHHDMDVTVRVEMVAMATSKDAYGKMKADQLSGRDRIHAHKTSDVLAAIQNRQTLASKKGEIIITLVDEADRDMFNPSLIGSSARDGVKDLFNHHLTNLETPALFLLNAAHKDIAHVWRRVTVGLWLGVQGLEGRMATIRQYLTEADMALPDDQVEYLTDHYIETPGVIEAVIKDVKSELDLMRADQRTTITPALIMNRLTEAFSQYERVNNQGVRPVPTVIKKHDSFDMGLITSEDEQLTDTLTAISRIKDFKGAAHCYLISGPKGSGKRALVHHLAQQIATNHGQSRPVVHEIGQPVFGEQADRAIADNAVVMPFNIPLQAIAFMDGTTPPMLYAQEMTRPIFYVFPSNDKIIHPHMSDCFHLTCLSQKGVLRACNTLMPDVIVDSRIQLIKDITIGDIIRLRDWITMREDMTQRRPDAESCLKRMMELKGKSAKNLKFLGGTSPKLYSLAEALEEQGIKTGTPAQTKPAGADIIQIIKYQKPQNG